MFVDMSVVWVCCLLCRQDIEACMLLLVGMFVGIFWPVWLACLWNCYRHIHWEFLEVCLLDMSVRHVVCCLWDMFVPLSLRHVCWHDVGMFGVIYRTVGGRYSSTSFCCKRHWKLFLVFLCFPDTRARKDPSSRKERDRGMTFFSVICHAALV